jgi:hypothetical protein
MIFFSSKLKEKHAEHLRVILQVLREHKPHTKLSKCEFCKRKVDYLGQNISKEGISMDPKKIVAFMGCPPPRNVSNVWSFMGLVRYYRRFIEGFSTIAYFITLLQKKGIFVGIGSALPLLENFAHVLVFCPDLNG